MNASKVAAYSGGCLGPEIIKDVVGQVTTAGWTTVMLGLFHISRADHTTGDIIYFNETLVVDKGKPVADLATWQSHLNQLKQSGIKIYASIGGADDVIFDFRTIRDVYNNNSKSFDNTILKANLLLLRSAVPAIDGIDMDDEENVDLESFVAFCRMVRELGWDITFCAFGDQNTKYDHEFAYWISALKAVEQSDWGKGAVKQLNLQMYAPRISPIPDWVVAIEKAIPGFSTHNFIVPGLVARYKDGSGWDGACPNSVKDVLVYWRKDSNASIGGAFLWNLDPMLNTANNPEACDGHLAPMSAYAGAIKGGLQT